MLLLSNKPPNKSISSKVKKNRLQMPATHLNGHALHCHETQTYHLIRSPIYAATNIQPNAKIKQKNLPKKCWVNSENQLPKKLKNQISIMFTMQCGRQIGQQCPRCVCFWRPVYERFARKTLRLVRMQLVSFCQNANCSAENQRTQIAVLLLAVPDRLWSRIWDTL